MDDVRGIEDRGFRLAGLDVLVRGAGARAPLPDGYASCRIAPPVAPDMIVELTHDAALEGRPASPGYPGFARRLEGGALRVERSDVEGALEVDATPLAARFRVAGHANSVEAAVRLALSLALPRHDALLLHASAVRGSRGAHAFAGVSGAGKSTIARLVADGGGGERLADDLLVLARRAGGWEVHVPPFVGLDGLPRGAVAPLAAIELIAQAPAHRRAPVAPGAAMRELMRHVVVYAAEPATAGRVLELTGRLVSEVACFRLEFAKDPSVAQVLDIT